MPEAKLNEVPAEWELVVKSVSKWREMFNLALRRGFFANIEENNEYMNAYGTLEYEVKRMINESMNQPEEQPKEQE